jgi:ubiquinone/menaquinone biosynthesis C-methylase UbiE
MPKFRSLLAISLPYFLSLAWLAPTFPRANAQQLEPRPTSKPYTGDLSVFESPGRAERLQINRVMDILNITAGKNVADIGAGSGWFTVQAAARVTNSAVVYAVDINPDAIRYIDNRIHHEHLQNVKTVLSNSDDPRLPTNSIDAVLLLKTYHEVAKPIVLFQNLRSSLRPGARIGVIDRNGNGEDHGVAREVVVREISTAGYKLVGQYEFVKGDGMDYFLIFQVD